MRSRSDRRATRRRPAARLQLRWPPPAAVRAAGGLGGARPRLGQLRQERRPLAARGRARRARIRPDEPQVSATCSETGALANQAGPRVATRGRAHDRRGRRRPVRVGGPSLRRPRRVRREHDADRGALAQHAPDRAGREQRSTSSGRSSRPACAGARFAAACSAPDDPRQRRHQRAAVRPAGRRRRSPRGLRAGDHPARDRRASARLRGLPSNSCPSRRSSSSCAVAGVSSAMRASAPSAWPCGSAAGRS